MEPHPIVFTDTALEAMLEAKNWWKAHRPKGPAAFSEELERILSLVAQHPLIGAKVRNPKLKGVRKLHLARIRYYLYYRIIDSPPAIEVLAFWHASRGEDPSL